MVTAPRPPCCALRRVINSIITFPVANLCFNVAPYHAINAASQSSHTGSEKSRYQFRSIVLKDRNLDNRHITIYNTSLKISSFILWN